MLFIAHVLVFLLEKYLLSYRIYMSPTVGDNTELFFKAVELTYMPTISVCKFLLLCIIVILGYFLSVMNSNILIREQYSCGFNLHLSDY